MISEQQISEEEKCSFYGSSEQIEQISHLIKMWNLKNYILSRLHMVLSQFVEIFNFYGNTVLFQMLSFRHCIFKGY